MVPTEFNQSIIQLITGRSSWRSYSSRPLDPETRLEVIDFLNRQKNGPFSESSRFQLIEKNDPAVFDNASLGTYGFIKNARSFIAGSVSSGPKDWEDYGYLLEKIILKMTGLGLGTCWLGGTFKRSEFGPLLKVQDQEKIPAITPVGYGTSRRSLRDLLIRRAAKSRSRKRWESLFFDEEFGNQLAADKTGYYEEVLNMVRLAPSASNRQPWRIVRNGGKYHFYLQRTPNYSGFTKSADLQRVDMGIAICHFDMTAKELNISGKWIVEPPAIVTPDLAEYTATWSPG